MEVILWYGWMSSRSIDSILTPANLRVTYNMDAKIIINSLQPHRQHNTQKTLPMLTHSSPIFGYSDAKMVVHYGMDRCLAGTRIYFNSRKTAHYLYNGFRDNRHLFTTSWTSPHNKNAANDDTLES